MSHYAVAVFSLDGDFDKLLAPYLVSNPKEQVFFSISYDQIEQDFKKFKQQNKSWTIDQYIEMNKYFDTNGQWGYMKNPHGYFDYYTLDGQDYMFELKEGVLELPDGAWDYCKNDYEWYPDMKDEADDAREFWDDFIGETALASPPGIWNKKYYLERYKTRAQYIKEMSRMVPYAFVLPDGGWHAPGKVGSFGTSNEDADAWNKYVNEWDEYLSRDDNPYVNLVDCHI